MKTLGILLALICIFASSELVAVPPPQAVQELNSAKVSQLLLKVDQLPVPLRNSLGRTFHQKVLQLGNPRDLIGGAVTYTGDAARFAPHRRLIFAFNTQRYAFVYYEKGDPELGAACLIFDTTKLEHPRLVWGGVDLDRPFARNVSELRTRITHGKLWDDHPYIW